MYKKDLSLTPPLMNSAGAAGFTPDVHSTVDWSRLGAFITNPISLRRRTPAHGLRFAAFAGGYLLHTGYPNPGLKQVIHGYARHWKQSPIAVIVHLLAREAEEVAQMTRQLEAVEGVTAVEIGVASETEAWQVKELAQAARGELPVIMRLPMERSAELAGTAMEAGAAAISLAAPRGELPGPRGEFIQGRLYGPAIFPLALRLTHELSQREIPIIAAGGVTTRRDVETMLAAGALAVQLDSVLWRLGGYNLAA